MSEPQEPQAEQQLDPKEAMRQALERKKHKERHSAAHGIEAERGSVHTHGKIGGKREFRRKSG